MATSLPPPSVDSSEDHKRCISRLEGTIANHRIVHKLLDSITSLGCSLPKDFFLCRKCDYDMTGGLMLPSASSSQAKSNETYQPRIVLCEDKKIDRQTFDNTIIHELLHAYDVCRAKLDWKNCEHHACTEIRASALSGECAMSRELLRGKYHIRGGHRDCVKRRAAISLSANTNCTDTCSESIEAAFEQCYNDFAPFTGPRG